MTQAVYIHGTDFEEQKRLAKLGELTDEAFVRFIEISPTASVLDIGSGLGNLDRRIALLIPEGEVVGVEQSKDQLAKATQQLLPNLHFYQADAHALPFEKGRFDIVYCRYLLEHVTNPLSVLQEAWRVLKPGGKMFAQENNILVSTFDPDCPYFDSLWRRFAKLQQLLGGDALIGKKLFRFFKEAGFKDIQLSIQPEVHYFGTPSFKVWVQNLIDNIRPSQGQLIERGLATRDDIDRGIEELRRHMDDPSASVFFYWNRAMGVKKLF